MKKILITLITALCFSTAAFSQNIGATEIGFVAGYNAAKIADSYSSGNNFNNSSPRFRSGFNAGISAEHYFKTEWSFKTRVLYDQRGWHDPYDFIDATMSQESHATVNFNLDYITVPLLANWHFGRTRNWYLDFGPYVSFLISAKIANSGLDIKNTFNTIDAGLDLGIGRNFIVNERVNFFIELNGEGGGTNMINGTGGVTYRNITSALNIGFNFQ